MADAVWVHGIGIVGGFGCGRAELLSAIGDPPGPNATVEVRSPEGAVRLAACLADDSPLERFVSKRRLRRVDHFSRLAALGASLALADAGRRPQDFERLGVVLASGRGSNATTFRFMDSYIEFGDAGASPTLFSGSGQSGALSNVTILLGITGPLLTVCQSGLAVPMALVAARDWLLCGQADAVLVGAVEEYFPLLGYLWRQLYGPMSDGPVRPFDFAAQTAVLGEGAAFLLLAADERGDAPALGELAWGCWEDGPPEFPPGAGVILCADGHRRTGARYAEVAAREGLRCASYAPLFGALPSAMAFNLAVAAAGIREGALAAPPGCGTAPLPPNGRGASHALACLDVHPDGTYGLATVSASACSGRGVGRLRSGGGCDT